MAANGQGFAKVWFYCAIAWVDVADVRKMIGLKDNFQPAVFSLATAGGLEQLLP